MQSPWHIVETYLVDTRTTKLFYIFSQKLSNIVQFDFRSNFCQFQIFCYGFISAVSANEF